MQKSFTLPILFFMMLFAESAFSQIDCSSASTLQCGSPWSMTINAGVGNDNTSYCGFQNEGNESYFVFAPATSGNYFVSVEEFGGNATAYEMRYGECLGNNWNCLGIYSGNASTDFIYLVTGHTYVFCIDLQQSTSSFGGAISIQCPIPAPSNDDCSGALNLSCGNSVSGTLNGATPDNAPSCLASGNGEDGVWYVFAGNNSYVTLSTCGNQTQFDSQISVYTGDCSNLTCVAANDDNPLCELNGNSSYISFNALSGLNYFVRVHANTQPYVSYNFVLSSSCAPLCNAPGNDNCANAISLGSIASATCSNMQSNSTACATPSNIQPNCYSAFTTLNDVWYTFTPVDNDVELVLNAGYSSDIGVAIYKGSCESPVFVSCNHNASSEGGAVLDGLNAGTTYFLQFFSLQNASGQFTFCLSNPTCSTPINVNVANVSDNNAFIQWTSLNATGAFDVLVTTTNLGTDINSQNITNATIYGIPFNATPISGLLENTTYYVYVRQDCGNIDHSEWSSGISFITHWSAPNCNTASNLSCGSTYSLSFNGTGSLAETSCNNALGREFVFNFTPSLTGTYALNFSNHASDVSVSFKENDGVCNYSNSSCVESTGNNYLFFLTAGISYSIWIDALNSSPFGTVATWICPSLGEDPNNALLVNSTYYPVCNTVSGNLLNSLPTLTFGSNVSNQHDKWARFTALTSGVSIIASSAENIQIELRNSNYELIDSEDLTTSGNEILNSSNLTAGQTYFVGIISSSPLTGNGNYTLCVRQLKNGACGNNPSTNFSMGQFFKAQPATGASYRFQLTGTSGNALGQTVVKNQSIPQLILSSVFPSLHYDSDYSIVVSNIYTLTNGTGQSEIVTLPSSANCSIHINSQPLAVLRFVDRCIVTTKPRVSFIGATPFVFGATGWKWQFQKLDALGNFVGSAITHDVLNATNYLNIGNVALLEYGTSYSVSSAPVFTYGAGNFGSAYTLCIAPFSGFTEENNNRSTLEETSIHSETTLFPNPSHMNCSITSNKPMQRIRVYDLSGRKVEDVNGNGGIRFELNTSDYSSGLFHIEVQTSEKTEVLKLVVTH